MMNQKDVLKARNKINKQIKNKRPLLEEFV